MKPARLAATLVTIVVLAGCSADADPKVEPTESAEAPATTPPEPTNSPVVLGPEESVRAWIDARNILLLEGDSTRVEELSAPECTTCRWSVDPVKKVYREGGRFETSGWRVSSSTIRSEGKREAVVALALVIPGGRTIPAIGAAPVTYSEEKRIVLVSVKAGNPSWLVTKLTYLS